MLNDLLKIHKKAVLFSGNGLNVDCILKPTTSHEGFKLVGFSSFIGLTFEDNGTGFFGDSFELTINYDDLKEKTDLLPTKAWGVVVTLPQMNNAQVPFKIENIAIDRTLGMILIKCSASTGQGNGKQANTQIGVIKNNHTGGI